MNQTSLLDLAAAPPMSLCDRLEMFFRDRPEQWIDGRVLGTVAGAYAWRSRVSQLRRERGMQIANRQRRVDGYVVSEYRWQRAE